MVKSAGTTKVFQPVPEWAHDVLQGLAYWIGYRRCYYRSYPLLEGAITAELCELLSAKLDPGQHGKLFCEVPYSNLTQDHTTKSEPDGMRLDLLIAKDPGKVKDSGKHNFFSSASIAIEVKRGSASTSEIVKDVSRLATLNHLRPDIRTFLLIVSEEKLPRQFGWFANSEKDHEIIAAKGVIRVDVASAVMKVRRVCKALGSFKATASQTAVLVEVVSSN